VGHEVRANAKYQSGHMSSDIVLRLENVTRQYGTGGGVIGASLELKRGEILTLLGPSGCGKTTTLRIAMGLERARQGKVTYMDRVVDSPADKTFVPPEGRGMGMVFQSYAIWPHMNVFENVAFPLRARKAKKAMIAERVSEVLSLVGLSGFEKRPGTQLSGGQAQRVAVARALACKPDVLLMDEPFSNIDAKLRESMRAELRLLQRRLNFSILFVTHDQIEALALSDRVAVMNTGRIEQVGAPASLYANPATSFVRDFLGRSLLFPAMLMTRSSGATEVKLSTGQLLSVTGSDHSKASNAGDACVIAIRPEEVVVEPGEAEGANVLPGTISILQFVGEYYEASVEIPGGSNILVHLPRSREWHEGQKIVLRLAPEKLHLWDKE